MKEVPEAKVKNTFSVEVQILRLVISIFQIYTFKSDLKNVTKKIIKNKQSAKKKKEKKKTCFIKLYFLLSYELTKVFA